MEDIKRVLKPDGLFVTYNYFRQGWVVDRLSAMARSVFGCEPTVLILPFQETVPSASPVGFAMVIGGCNPRIAQAFAERGNFWLNTLPPQNANVDGFAVRPENLPQAEQTAWQRVAPARLLEETGAPIPATDDWPFLYLQGRLIPGLTIRSMILLGVLGLGMVYAFLPKAQTGLRINGRMFFLGAAFMLLETKAVVQLALLFGSTWIVNSLVFLTVLVLILLANLFVLRAPLTRLAWHYAGLFALLASPSPCRSTRSSAAAFSFATCCLARSPSARCCLPGSFSPRPSETPDPDMAFGSNIAGSVVGGIGELFSMLLGFRYLLLIAIALYALSAFVKAPRSRIGA